jgi:antitoxin (DNA-binding transcriptional repressor) of toxin-antitoxin stability system
MKGEEVIIANAGRPVARLLPYRPQPEQRTPGNDAGKVVIALDFDEPLPEFEEL